MIRAIHVERSSTDSDGASGTLIGCLSLGERIITIVPIFSNGKFGGN
jgi:hypothetical protein